MIAYGKGYVLALLWNLTALSTMYLHYKMPTEYRYRPVEASFIIKYALGFNVIQAAH